MYASNDIGMIMFMLIIVVVFYLCTVKYVGLPLLYNQRVLYW